VFRSGNTGKASGTHFTDSATQPISLIQNLDEDASLDDVIDRLYLLRKVELGIAQADAGEVMEHEEFMDELEAEDAE
jgi:hypothetical protein